MEVLAKDSSLTPDKIIKVNISTLKLAIVVAELELERKVIKGALKIVAFTSAT
jgi:hypothetical protein